MLLGTCVDMEAADGPATCAVAAGLECTKPRHYDEVNATSPGDCCDWCIGDPRCVFWSFKASDVPVGISCRRFDTMPVQNRSSSSFTSGSVDRGASNHTGLRLRVDGHRLRLPNGTIVRPVGMNWPLEHVMSGDGATMRAHIPEANVVRIIGVLWDNSPASSDCMSQTAP